MSLAPSMSTEAVDWEPAETAWRSVQSIHEGRSAVQHVSSYGHAMFSAGDFRDFSLFRSGTVKC